MNAQEEVQHILRLLQAVFRLSKKPIREFEREVGMGSGTLTRVFSGEIQLKMRTVFEVLNGLAIPPEDFFRMAYKDRPKRSEVLAEDVLALVERNPPRREGAPEALSLTPDELDRRIVQALREHGLLPDDEPGAGARRKSSRSGKK